MRVNGHLPIAKFFQVSVLDDLTALELFDDHLIVFFALVVVTGCHDSTLNRQDAT